MEPVEGSGVEEDGSSFSAFVLAERLFRARRMLADRRYAHLNIAPTDIREAARRHWLW
jgi:hypothetical protein